MHPMEKLVPSTLYTTEMEKRWLYHSLPAAEEIQELGKTLNINSQLTTLLWQRGHRDFETAKNFFRPSLSHLHDPFLMKDMELAVTRLKKVIDDDEKILVYGDYDVEMGKDCSIWYNAVIRGDVHYIKLGNKVNVQDNVMLHCTYEKFPLVIGNNVSIGHNACVHGCTIQDNVS